MWSKYRSQADTSQAAVGNAAQSQGGSAKPRWTDEMYRTIFENSAVAITVTDENENIVFWNGFAESLLGMDRDDLYMKPVSTLYPEEEWGNIRSKHVRQKGMQHHFETTIVRKDREVIDVGLALSILTGQNGKVMGTIGMITDITERKRAERALRESEEKFKRLVEDMNDGYCVIQGHRVVFANARSAEMFGYAPEDVMGRSLHELLPPKEVAELSEVRARRQRDRNMPPQYEMTLTRRDGTCCPVEFGARLTEYGGEPAISVVMRDITLRKQMEEALRQSEQNYRALFESALEGVVGIDGETLTIVIANKTAASMYDLDSAEDVIGVNPLDFVHRDDRERVLRIIVEEVLQKDLRRIHEFRMTTRVGRESFISAVGALSEYKGRRICLLSMRDITERNQAEEEKQRIERQLQSAKRLAGVGKLAAGLAHELSNPLAAVEATAQFLAVRKDLEESMKSDVETIYRETQRATRITQNLLSFARKQKPEKSPVIINEALIHSLDLHASRMEAHNIIVDVQLDSDHSMTLADFDQIQQVFGNIITNAEQAMTESHGGGKLSVTTRTIGEMIRITFTDDGPGISEENLKKIFDPFFTTKEVGKGPGLGLSVCYGIVQEHGGQLYAVNNSDSGASFVIEMPLFSKDQNTVGQIEMAEIKRD